MFKKCHRQRIVVFNFILVGIIGSNCFLLLVIEVAERGYGLCAKTCQAISLRAELELNCFSVYQGSQ